MNGELVQTTDSFGVVIKQGAEARLYKGTLFNKNVIIKQRFKKKYRHPSLDNKITHKRTLQEVRAILKCRKAGIKTPLVYFVNYINNTIYMEEIENSVTVREKIDAMLKCGSRDQVRALAEKMGSIISVMHQVEIIHGDLTTSNILISDDSLDKLTVIDFGLSFSSNLIEDMGVDLYVLERAFLSTHPNTEWLFNTVLEKYKEDFKDEKRAVEILDKLDEVRSRGRKRDMTG